MLLFNVLSVLLLLLLVVVVVALRELLLLLLLLVVVVVVLSTSLAGGEPLHHALRAQPRLSHRFANRYGFVSARVY